MIVVKRNGKLVRLERKPFSDEEELRRYLLSNLQSVLVEDLSEGDRDIVAWRREFPLINGSADLVAVGDNGGIYLVETKLYRNPDKRSVVAQVFCYAAEMWEKYRYDLEGFLSKLSENREEVLEDEGFRENLRKNLGSANYNIVIAMDSIPREVKGLIEFLNRYTAFRVLALEIERYEGEGLEVIAPRIYGLETSREPVVGEARWWSQEELRRRFERIADVTLKKRLLRMLEWALKRRVFAQSKSKEPLFGLKGVRGRIFNVDLHGLMYVFFGFNEKGKYSSDEERYKFVEELKSLGLLQRDLDPDSISSGKILNKRLNELSDEEFERLCNLLEHYLEGPSQL